MFIDFFAKITKNEPIASTIIVDLSIDIPDE